MKAQVSLGTDRFIGTSYTISGDGTFATSILTDTTNAMFFSDQDDSFVNIKDLLVANLSGPMLDMDVGVVPEVSAIVLDNVRFVGDLIGDGSGTGTIGTVQNADRLIINGGFYLGREGLSITGTVNELAVIGVSMSSSPTAPAYKAIEIESTATTDIVDISACRFNTKNAADRCVLFDSSATYASPINVINCFIRGSGQFVDAAGLQKTDVNFLAANNEGPTAPVDSVFAGNAVFSGNATNETVITTAGATNEVPIGTGTPAHPVFNGGAFVERFELLGVETQLQRFHYRGERARTFRVSITVEVDRVGGGTQTLQIALQKNDVTDVPSRFPFSISAADKVVNTSAVFELDTNDTVRPVVANVGATNNMIVKICQWSIETVG
jgi:hypothetical protein